MALWQLDGEGSATPVVEERLKAEVLIESAVESAPELLGVDVLIVGRQVSTPSGPLDLLGLDGEGHLVVIENKRDRTPRDVLAQTLDHAAYVSMLAFDDVVSIYEAYCARSGSTETDLAEVFEERFGEPLDTIVYPPRMIVVASRMDDSTERMIAFLADGVGVPVNATLFQPFAGGPHRQNLAAGRGVATSDGTIVQQHGVTRPGEALLGCLAAHWQDRVAHHQAAGERPQVGAHQTSGCRWPAAALAVWVSSTEAYAEVQLDDDDPAMNGALLNALKANREVIEHDFGAPLDWRGPELGGLMTKRTKVVAPKVPIGDRSNPTAAGLNSLADSAQRLVKAVQPHLQDANEAATNALIEIESDEDESDSTGDGVQAEQLEAPIA